MKLTQARLKELLNYDPLTGIFARLITVSNYKAKKGDVAGSINDQGYTKIQIDGKRYKASRLAWFYMEGYWPEYEIDHKNRIRHDNKWKNLRHVSHSCNVRNSGISINNKSGIVGVHWDKKRNKWQSQIKILGNKRHLGYFTSKVNAAKARWNAEIKHGYPGCNTTSSAFLYLQTKGV